MNTKEKKEFDKWMLKQKVLADNFKLSVEDIHNLYDMFYMITWQDYEKVFKPNKMHKWFEEFFDRLEEVCLDELNNKMKKEV